MNILNPNNTDLPDIDPRASFSPLLILVRHGEAQHMVTDLTGGWTDTDLTENGRRQAEAVAERLSIELDGQKSILYSSSLKRAVQTAEPISRKLGLSFTRHDRLRELNNGIAAGLTQEEAKKHYNDTPKISLDWHPYPESESWREFYQRVSSFMESTLRSFNETPVFVSHGGTIHMITSWWLGLKPEHMNDVFFSSAPTGVTILHIDRLGNKVLERLNDTSHLTIKGARNPFPSIQS